MNASALNWGGGAPGFPARNLYVVAFSGVLVELENATDRPPPAGAPRLALDVAPVRATRRTKATYRFTVTAASTALKGAVVRIGNRRATTDASGVATLKVRFFHPGLKSARASYAGYRSVTRKVRIR
jgi:hypothetical protein